MARLILKAPYYKPLSRVPSGTTRGGYANYIATREGVEILPRGAMVGYIGERRGSNGLFSDDGDPVILSQITKLFCGSRQRTVTLTRSISMPVGFLKMTIPKRLSTG